LIVKQYQIYLYDSPNFAVLGPVTDIKYTTEETKYKFWTRRYGPVKPKKFLEIEYQDQFFDLNIKKFENPEIGITILVSDNQSGTAYEQIDSEVKFSLKPGKIIFEYDDLTQMTGFMMYTHPIYIEASKTYLQDKASWERDRKISSILS